MASDVEICNLALGHCGSKKIIQSLDESTTEAELCNRFFEHARDVMLQEEEWDFATAYKTLALLPDDPDTAAFAYAYDYPNDCLKIRYINQGAEHFDRANSVPFKRALNDDGDGQIIMCNVQDAVICYTKKVTNSQVFSPAVAGALGAKLATYINMPLTQDMRRQQGIQNAYIELRAEAISIERNEAEEGLELQSTFATARTR